MWHGPDTWYGWVAFWIIFTILTDAVQNLIQRYWRWRFARACQAYAAALPAHVEMKATLTQETEAGPAQYRRTIKILKARTRALKEHP